MPRQLKQSEIESVLKQLAAKQGGKCAICGHPATQRDPFVLDHCHTTGYIRGALHRSCNGAEGRIKAKAQMGHRGIAADDYVIGLGEYLAKHKTPQYPLIHPQHLTEDQKRIKRNAKARKKRAEQRAAKG